MDKFVIFKFRQSIIDDIKNSPVDKLHMFQDYGLTIKEIALVWMITNDNDDESIIENFYNFHGLLPSAKKDYIRYYNQLAERQAETEKATTKFVNKVEKFDPSHDFSDMTPFASSRNNIIIRYDGDIKLLPTEQIPMFKALPTGKTVDISNTSQSGSWIKLNKGFTDVPELERFFESDEQGPQYVFKIPSSDKEKLLNKGKIFTEQSKIVIPVEPTDTNRIVDIIKTNLSLENIKWNKEYINGEFTIHGMNFDWNVFAMMLAQKNFYDNTIFIAEDGLILSKKNKFIVKYQKYGPEFSPKPIFFTLSNVDNDLVVKIAKIPHDKDVDSSIKLILYLLSEYIEEEEGIIELYKSAIPSFKSIKKAKKVAEKQVITKTRLEPLKKFDPEIFGGDYKKQCQGASKQPRIPTAKEAAALLRDKPEEIIEFPHGSKKYYTCLPFEKTKGTVNKYPGLIKKDGKYVPCCYAKSHHDRPNSPLNKYIAEATGLVVESEKHISDNILGKDKRLPEFRRGYVSDRLGQILKFLELKPGDYLRYGVPVSGQSVIDAMACIYDYTGWMKNAGKVRKVVVEKLLKSSQLNAAAQTYDYDYLVNAFADGAPITASGFHPVMEYFFKATVLVIDGHDLARPESKFGFIPHLRKRKNMIILYVVNGQVEVVGNYDFEFTTYPQRTINKCLEAKRRCYGFYSPFKYVFPRIAALQARATAQYLDNFGKNRGFLVDGQSIFMPPSAPVSLPTLGDLFFGDVDAVMKEFGIVGKYYKDGIVYSDQFALPVEEAVELPEPPEDYVLPYVFSSTSFIKTSAKAELKAKNKFIKPIELDPKNILTIYPLDMDKYLALMKKLPDFTWVQLSSLVWVLGKVHWVLVDGVNLMVTDVEFKTDGHEDVGTWSVSLDSKISEEGSWVEYPGDHFGLVTVL